MVEVEVEVEVDAILAMICTYNHYGSEGKVGSGKFVKV